MKRDMLEIGVLVLSAVMVGVVLIALWKVYA